MSERKPPNRHFVAVTILLVLFVALVIAAWEPRTYECIVQPDSPFPIGLCG